MILMSKSVSFESWIMIIATNQRLVNTTPKPKATKKSSGELVGPFELLVDVVDMVGAAVVKVGELRLVGVVSVNCVDDVCSLCGCPD